MTAANATTRHLAWALALSLTAATWGGASWAQQKPEAKQTDAKPTDAKQAGAAKPADAKGENERILSQKAVMLEVYLGSQRVTDALKSGDQKSVDAVARARADLAAGAASLNKGDFEHARESLDAGLRHITTLVLQQGVRAEDPAKQKEDFKLRKHRITSLLKALEAGGDTAALSPWTARIAVARKGIGQAEEMFGSGKIGEANQRLVSIYEDVVVIVSEARKNQSIVYRLNFATPAEEYAYELERNKSYEILVDIAVAEKENPDKALTPYIRKLVLQSNELRERATAQATSGDHVAAIKTLEDATSHLVRALRGAGVMVME